MRFLTKVLTALQGSVPKGYQEATLLRLPTPLCNNFEMGNTIERATLLPLPLCIKVLR